ncbi:hypothetical protein BDM02DRAFT_3089999 [Thelephora ganbajun]|uniref:Uncharacterized protein n=1 Tax=Thelephora ganbajun TaxID=370292 RepID=A0ACB6ZRH0_THEGA|nr:hypothetical protein BDM02DRAFT_3089999 [Thelephora ganbajun]
MGVLCSKPRTLEGGHKVIGTTHTLNGDGASGEDRIPVNPRQAALEAAEMRKQREQRRGTNTVNPNAGKLSSQLAAKNKSKGPEPRQPDKPVVSTRLLLRCRLDYG